jgi:UDP-glucose 4-epimerase
VNRERKDRVVVTGAAGFIGSALCNYLASEFLVTGLDNLSTGDWSRCSENVNKVNVDISKMKHSALQEFLTDAKYVFHLAAVKLHNQVNDYHAIQKSNIEGSRRIFEAATSAKVEKIVFASSLYSYGNLGPSIMHETDALNPQNFYGLSKAYGESLLRIITRRNDVDYAIARLFFIYGPNQFASGGYKSVIIKNIENVINGHPLEVYGDGAQSLDYVYIDDCVEILAQLAKSEFQGHMNISTGAAVSINTVLKSISRLSGESRVIEKPADWTQGSIRVGSTLLREKVLGPRAMVTIEEGLNRTWNWAKSPKPTVVE